MFRIRKLDMNRDGLRLLEQELDCVADKHGIEEPPRFMPDMEELFGKDDDDEC